MTCSTLKLTFFCFAFVISHSKKAIRTELPATFGTVNAYNTVSLSKSEYRANELQKNYKKRGHLLRLPDLAVTFEAPKLGAYDYWKQNFQEENHENRKFFFETNPQRKRTSEWSGNDFYRFVNNFFQEGSPPRKATIEPLHHAHRGVDPLHWYFHSHGFKSPETAYIQNKPIRASVIKLETVTKFPPIRYPENYKNLRNYHWNGESLLNQVLIENTRQQNQKDFTLHYHNPSYTVLSEPINIVTTTEKNDYTMFFSAPNSEISKISSKNPKWYNDTHISEHTTASGHKERIAQMTIPYITSSTLPSAHKNKIIYPNGIPEKILTEVKFYELNNARNSDANSNEHQKSKNNFKAIKSENISQKSILIRNASIFGDYVNLPDRTSIETIANLTAKGVSELENDNPNLKNHINHYNVRNLINYEKIKLENAKKELKTQNSKNYSSSKLESQNIDFNDELSLDVKILKDTNWDGLTPTLSHQKKSKVKQGKLKSSEENAKISKVNSVKLKKEMNFWEIDGNVKEIQLELPKQESSDSPEVATETATEVAEPITTASTETTHYSTYLQTVTEFPDSKPTQRIEFLPDVVTTETIISEEAKSDEIQGSTKAINEVISSSTKAPNTISMSDVITTTLPRRKYRKKMKISNFSGKRTSGERLRNSNNLPKPKNETLTSYTESNSKIKLQDTSDKEMMAFPGENERKRKRKPSMRRIVYKKVRRVTTTEKRLL